jgi:hypothetical protein
MYIFIFSNPLRITETQYPARLAGLIKQPIATLKGL